MDSDSDSDLSSLSDFEGIPINTEPLQQALDNPQNQSKINFNDPQSIYSGTQGLGNCVVPITVAGVTIYLPGWEYRNNDGNVGKGVLTFSTFQGKTATHHLYKDLNTDTSVDTYFYVTRHGKNDGHGLEAQTRRQLQWDMPSTAPNGMAIPDRLIADATVGADDSYEKNTPRLQVAVIHVSNPHLSKEDFMNCVYPHYDNPAGQVLSFNDNPSTFLNETVDDPEYTPNEDSETNNSPKSGATQNPKTNM